MLSPEEQDIIKQLQTKPTKTSTTKSIHLEAIMFYSPTNWILWVNGQKITPAKQSNYKVLKVTKEGAEFEMILDNKLCRFWLNINQKYWFTEETVL